MSAVFGFVLMLTAKAVELAGDIIQTVGEALIWVFEQI